MRWEGQEAKGTRRESVRTSRGAEDARSVNKGEERGRAGKRGGGETHETQTRTGDGLCSKEHTSKKRKKMQETNAHENSNETTVSSGRARDRQGTKLEEDK